MSTNSDTWQSTIFINSPIHGTLLKIQILHCKWKTVTYRKKKRKNEEQEEDTSSIVKWLIPTDVSLLQDELIRVSWPTSKCRAKKSRR